MTPSTPPTGAPGLTIVNDNFGSATQSPRLLYAQTGIATANATKEGLEQSPSCGSTIDKTVWWRFTPATNMRVKAETTGSGFDTILAAWMGSTLGALTPVACNDDAGGAAQPLLFEADGLPAGVTYYFQAGGYGAAGGGSLNFSLSRVTNAPPNDDFVNATGVGSLPFEPAAVPTGDAMTQAGEPLVPCSAIGKTVWFRFTPATNMRVKAETTGSAFCLLPRGLPRNLVLTGLTQAACKDDLPGAPGSSSPSRWT